MYFSPLLQRAVLALDSYPTHLAADAAYDTWYIYEKLAHGPGIAAVALNTHGHELIPLEEDGTPLCPIGLRMQPGTCFLHTRGYRAQRFRCPLLFPEKTGQSCEHEQFQKGKGCVKDINQEKGWLMRTRLDRTGPLYHAVYNQRTSAERINSKAKEIGLERPKVRNLRSVRNLNTLTYLVLNVRVLTKAKSINAGLLSTFPGGQLMS